MAKIELVARPVDIMPDWVIDILEMGESAAQHLFIMQTKDNGEIFTISGGPENFKSGGVVNKAISSLVDDIKVRKKIYEKSDEYDYRKYFKSKLIIEASDDVINSYISKIWLKAAQINRGGFDYKWLTKGDEQNSNTVARVLLEAAGLKFELPIYKSGKPVLAPSYDAEIDHSYMVKTGIGNNFKEYFFAKDMMKNLGNKINKAYAKYPDRICEIKECIEEEVSQSTSKNKAEGNKGQEEKKSEDTFDKVDKMFGYFNSVNLDKKETNLERFKTLEEDAKERGDYEFAGIFGNLVNQQKQVLRLFEHMETPGYKNAKSLGDKMRNLNKNIEQIKGPNEDVDGLESVFEGFKDDMADLNTAFEKCAPDTFYEEGYENE